ncbi:MAG: hypothetical protein BroJett011_45970 [Chloroflexota bacterium]|nr:MAG: hypothetical protein BroJett011_45970 [Chloroflexota bacterium]
MSKNHEITRKVARARLIEFITQTQWYHTLELLPGVSTSGTYNHNPYLHLYGFPQSLQGYAVLDAGAGDGFFSFEFERRGASRVQAIDTNKFDGSPAISPSPSHLNSYQKKYHSYYETNVKFSDVYNALGVPCGHQFMAAKALLNSSVDYRNISVYDLSSLDTQYDFVFCGDLIEHLKNPLFALENLAAVTKKQCIISLSSVPPAASNTFNSPLKKFSHLKTILLRFIEKSSGISPQLDTQRAVLYYGNDSGGSFFHFYPEAFRQALLAAGFSRVDVYSHFYLPNLKYGTNNLHVIYHCYMESEKAKIA